MAVAGLALAFAGCGEDQQAAGQQQQAAEQQQQATRELEQAQRELRKERRRLGRERKRERKEESRAASPEGTAKDLGASSGSERGKVPNVEGEDHQLAQDTMQAAGFYNISEEDASGEDRPLLFDRNWEVVSQSPSGGTRASLDRTIVLRSKKDEE